MNIQYILSEASPKKTDILKGNAIQKQAGDKCIETECNNVYGDKRPSVETAG